MSRPQGHRGAQGAQERDKTACPTPVPLVPQGAGARERLRAPLRATGAFRLWGGVLTAPPWLSEALSGALTGCLCQQLGSTSGFPQIKAPNPLSRAGHRDTP